MGGLRFKRWCWVCNGAYNMSKDYSNVGFDLSVSRGQGGKFIAPLEVREECHKRYARFVCDSFGCCHYGGGEGGLMLVVQDALLMMCYQKYFPLSQHVSNSISIYIEKLVW